MVAGKTEASEYISEWRRAEVATNGAEVQAAAEAMADELEDEFPLERLNQFVEAGGWNPQNAADPTDDPQEASPCSRPCSAAPPKRW